MTMTTATAPADQPGLSTDETIRMTVRALRSARQVDAKVLATALGISRQSLYNRLNGAAQFLAAEIAILSVFFDVPIIDFYEGTVRVGRHIEGAITGIGTSQ
jgi:transcriptional regulator with XRE-family HTH domain